MHDWLTKEIQTEFRGSFFYCPTSSILYPMFQHPWIVSIQNSEGSLHCGGSIVSSSKVVTAAHCFADKKNGGKMAKDELDKFSIVVGTDDPFAFHGNQN